MNAQQMVRLPLAERVLVGRKVFAGRVDTMSSCSPTTST